VVGLAGVTTTDDGGGVVVDHVYKRYEPPPRYLRRLVRVATGTPVEALRDVSVSVAAGEVAALVGPNGAGKTTLIKIISTLLEPSSGSVHAAGVDVGANPLQARQRLGLVLSDDRGLYWRLSGRRNLEFFGVLAGLSPTEAASRATEVLRRVGLDDADKLVFGYSSGMRTRLNVARALLAEPRLLVLDEPTRSLDPIASDAVWQLIRELADAGKAVVVSTHDIRAVLSWCDRVIVLVDGRLRGTWPIVELSHAESPEAAIVDALGGRLPGA
jgi:ABC-2 type transport system ATP-binding protein